MQVDAGLSLADGAWLASANYLGTLLGAVAAMVLRVPIPPAVRAGLVTIGLATLAMGVERRVPAWIVLRFVAGLATGWVLPFASGWALERLAPLGRPLLNATAFAGVGVGIASAGLAAPSTFAAADLSRWLGTRRLWSLGHLVMAVGVVLPVMWPGIASIMLSALLVGGAFTVITMAGFQEGREVAGVRMIAAL